MKCEKCRASGERKSEWAVSCVVCRTCGYKWVAVRDCRVSDEKIQCPNCKKRGVEEAREVEE